MTTTYRITYLAGQLDTSVCPPAIVSALFPAFDGWAVSLSSTEIIVVAPSPQTPVELSPLVKVEQIDNA